MFYDTLVTVNRFREKKQEAAVDSLAMIFFVIIVIQFCYLTATNLSTNPFAIWKAFFPTSGTLSARYNKSQTRSMWIFKQLVNYYLFFAKIKKKKKTPENGFFFFFPNNVLSSKTGTLNFKSFYWLSIHWIFNNCSMSARWMWDGK